MDHIALHFGPFDPYVALSEFSRERVHDRARYGAEAHFIGTLRDFNEGRAVERLWLEHYPGMTERELARLVAEERQRLAFGPALIVHRVGDVQPGETLVLVALWSPHRKAALEGTRALIERLKYEAPLWKREQGPDGIRWVEKNTPG